MADPFQRVVEVFAERDRKTTEQLGCPLSLRVDGDITCERAIRPRIELAKLNARVGALVKAAGPLLGARRRAVSGAVLIEMAPEDFHALREAIEQLRGDE